MNSHRIAEMQHIIAGLVINKGGTLRQLECKLSKLVKSTLDFPGKNSRKDALPYIQARKIPVIPRVTSKLQNRASDGWLVEPIYVAMIRLTVFNNVGQYRPLNQSIKTQIRGALTPQRDKRFCSAAS